MARARDPLCSFCVCAPDPRRAGKFMLCITFSGVFLYSSEVFPTAVRTQGMGLSSLAARFGAGYRFGDGVRSDDAHGGVDAGGGGDGHRQVERTGDC